MAARPGKRVKYECVRGCVLDQEGYPGLVTRVHYVGLCWQDGVVLAGCWPGCGGDAWCLGVISKPRDKMEPACPGAAGGSIVQGGW